MIYRLPLLRVAQRARLVGVARGGVPRQQLDPAVLGVLRPVRDDVPDAERGGHRRAAHGRAAVLQQVDDADRPDPAVPDRRRAAAGVAQVDAARTCAISSCGRSLAARRHRRRAVRARACASGASGLCFALCGVRARHDRAGVLARRARARRSARAPTSSPR